MTIARHRPGRQGIIGTDVKYDRTVIAYHGCDTTTAEEILAGATFKKSQNNYDWLGEGIYFCFGSSAPTVPSSSQNSKRGWAS